MFFARTKQLLEAVAADQRDGEGDRPAPDLHDLTEGSRPERPVNPRDFAPPVAGGPPPPSRRTFLGGLLVAGGAGGTAVAAAALGPDAPGPLRAALDRMTAVGAEVRRIEASGRGLPDGPESEEQEDQLAEALDRAGAISRELVALVMVRSGRSLDSLIITRHDEDSPRAIASAREGRLIAAVTISARDGWMFDVVGPGYCVRPSFMELTGVEP